MPVGPFAVEVAPGDFGQDVGLECKVLPLWAVQDVTGHPLALVKKEYATLLRLLEAVMAPGWTHRDGRVNPPGLLGTRTGRGAATDRLALLLLVLEARETGRVRLCGGTVDTKRGRAATTVARLLGCTASAGERVLERLEDLGAPGTSADRFGHAAGRRWPGTARFAGKSRRSPRSMSGWNSPRSGLVPVAR